MSRTSAQIQEEIVGRFGFFPPFFEPALPSPSVLENLWSQTVFAYLDNPFPALFKEKLNAYLSRFCVVPYCMVCHSATLRPLGMTPSEVLTLLETPPPIDLDIDAHLSRLHEYSIFDMDALVAGSPLEESLLACVVAVFLEGEQALRCRSELVHLLSDDLYNHLTAYLAYIKTCHTWIEMHPEVSYEADERAKEHLGPMLAQEPALAAFFRDYRSKTASEREHRTVREVQQAERLRADRAIRESEEKLRLLVEGAKDYAMIMLDVEGCIASWNAGAERILGYEDTDVLGLSIAMIFTESDRTAGVPEREIARAFDVGKANDERWHLRKDGSQFWADGVMEALRDEDGFLRGYAKILRDDTKRKLLEEAADAIHAREHRIAATLQQALLMTAPDNAFPGVDVKTFYEPASDEALVGGDFYDVFALRDGEVAMVVADVIGKGLRAAAHTAQIKYALRAFLREYPEPAIALDRLNGYLCESQRLEYPGDEMDLLVVLSLVVLDTATGEANFSVAGTEPPLILRAGGGVEQVAANGVPLGIQIKERFSVTTLRLEPGDILLMATDGVTEARQGREFLGYDGMVTLAVNALPLERLAPIGAAIVEGARAFAGGKFQDDVCLLLARFHGAPTSR
ncbi:MAG: SpoIIE family protein phosphatase [Capsulimonas sp.]|uniref:PP2C family protein-serine/threonine phosphatase n=1 Tax=Capsulimonas sp. TaxID=2494211 RepID=UPI003263EE21